MSNRVTYIILAGILILTAILRLVHPFSIPFSFDEMSALSRTHYGNLHDEIKYGVMLKDTHPAGVQVFLYYWTKLFGYSELVVKLPFIVCGILSVYFVFRLGKEWFNETTGLVCAAYFATIQYTIMYSQLARPYSSGLLISLLMVWYWNKVVFKSESKSNTLNLASYILFGTLCAYNHHFSLLFAAIVGITGLFFVRGKQLFNYALAGVSIFILYIPHLHIFFYQLHKGGVEEWLGKPGNTFIIHYIQYILQFSKLAYILAGFLFLYGLYRLFVHNSHYSIPNTQYYFISLAWFLIPFLIGFFYSKYVNAVLQYSVLIFSFPFMLFCFFGLLPNLKMKSRLVVVLVICTVNVFALVHKRQYYDIFYHSTYERQVLLNDSIYKKVGANNLIALSQSNPDSITSFYFRKYNTYVPYVWFPDSSSKLPLIQYLEQHKTTYLTYNDLGTSDLLYLPVILNYYPYISLQNNLAGGTNYIFSSKDGKNPYFFAQTVKECEKPYTVDSLHEWAPGFACDLSKMTDNRHNLILISLSLYPLGSMKDVVIVSELTSKDKQIHWSSTPVSEFIPDTTRNRWVKAYHAIKLPDINLNYPDIKVKVYIWNRGKRNFYMEDFGVKTVEGNPVIYGLMEKIQ